MDLGPWEIAIIAVVILVLFGSKKLPDTARSLGRSLRIFKSETKGLHDDEKAAAAPAATAPPQPQQAPAQQLPPVQQGDAPISGVPVNQDQVNRPS